MGIAEVSEPRARLLEHPRRSQSGKPSDATSAGEDFNREQPVRSTGGEIDAANPAGVTSRPAETRSDYRAAFELVYRQYRAAGLVRPNPTGVRIAPHQLSPECTVILAESCGRLLGTVSLVGDGGNGLPLERIFPAAVRSFRRRGLRLTEVGCLASVEPPGSFPSPVYVELTKATIHYARLGGFDRMIAAVHPRHGRFYQRAMGFERLGEEAAYDRVNGNRAVCVVGDPNDPARYREPWRELFFAGPKFGRARRVAPMSGVDRKYFRALKEIADWDPARGVRRAA
jgi:hypothetical protein